MGRASAFPIFYLIEGRMKLVRKGDVVFVQQDGFVGKTIRFFDKGKFSHVCLAVNDKYVIEADVDTKVAIRPLIISEYSLVEVVDLGLTDDEREEVFETASSMIGTGYDYIQLLWYVLKMIFHLKGRNFLNNPHYVICSELVFIALDKSGALKDLGIHEDYRNGIDLTPNQLYDLVKYISKN